MGKLFKKKPLDLLMYEAAEVGEHTLKRSLGWMNLVALGIGGIIGAGLFVRTAAAIADRAGPSVVLAFVVAGIGCTFAGLCYAEFASMIPVAGSAYTYSYATMGEFVAWIIGWDLILEYAVAAATVSDRVERIREPRARLVQHGDPVSMDAFAVRTRPRRHVRHHERARAFHFVSPDDAAHSWHEGIGVRERAHRDFESVDRAARHRHRLAIHQSGESHAIHSAATTHVTAQGITHHYGGVLGILGAAGVVFFAYIGFDAVSTAAQEARNPKRDMPIGILGSLVFCTILYVLFSYVLSGVATVEDFRAAGREASVAFAISKYMHGYEWLSRAVTVAILAGFSSVILVMLLGQSRVFFSMSRDGLVPPVFSEVHPRYRTPWKSNMLFFVFTGALAAFVPGRCHRRDDQHRHVVRVHSRLRRGLDHAREESRARTRVPRSRRAARRRSRHHHLRCDDLRTRLDQLDATHRLAAHRLHLLLRLRQEPQPHRRPAADGHAGGNKDDA